MSTIVVLKQGPQGPPGPAGTGISSFVDSTSTGTQNNYARGTYTWLKFTNLGAVTLTGIVAATDGVEVIVTAVGNTLTLSHQNVGSLAANRINTSTGNPVTLQVGQSARLVYDGNSGYWRIDASNGCLLIFNADVPANAQIAYSKLGGFGTESIGPQEFDSTIDPKGTEKNVCPVHVQTVDATQTTLASWTIPNGAFVVTCLVVGLKSDYTQAGAWQVTAAFRNNAGTVTQLGSTTVTPIGTPDDATWAVAFSNATTTAKLQVTGKAATTIQWSAITTRLEVIP